MTLEQILDRLRTDPALAPHLTAWHEIPARAGSYAPLPASLDPRLAAALRGRGIERLYSHQAQAWEAVRAGHHVVVVTPTASGKTLCYNLPVLDTLLAEPSARALYLFPTKALSMDQVDELLGLVRATDAEIRAYTYDGDTPGDARRAIRSAGHVVVTNPDMLHAAILPHHTKWLRLFEHLRYIVIDELHTYRGLFGSHMANVVRRLRRICRFYGSAPQVICASATIGNPRELAERLLEEPVSLVDENGAPSGPRVFAFYNPPVVNRELGIRRDALTEAGRLAAEFIRNRIPLIAFARSRRAAELLTTGFRRAAEAAHVPAGRVAGYRAGYLPSERRAIEEGLRSGQILAVAATNALELGIDIGRLRAALLVGYPGTIASTWQQAGRAGRTQDLAAAILVATSDPLDQYIVRHPEYFFGRPPEAGLVNPDNLYVLTSHVRCAAFELPFDDNERFGPSTLPEILAYLQDQGIVHREADRWHYVADAYPAQEVSLRSASTENVVIIDTTEPAPRVVGEVDLASAPGLVHEDAIYLHLGQQYHVDRLAWEERKAYVHRVDVDYYTTAQIATDIRVLAEFARGNGAPPPAHGEVVVTYRPTIYKKLTLDRHENIGWGPIHLPESTLHTTAYWLTVPDLAVPRDELQGALVALSHALAHVASLFLMCDPRDLGRAYEVHSPHTDRPTVYLYDTCPGGVGFAERLYRLHPDVLAAARELIAACPCAGGCPSCVGPVLEVGATGKARALQILDARLVPGAVG
ncbi:MAG: DEAD/DEAH box helicase [Armatimonadota bacterium]|nr:DEAD/DEAH box helicase [Armatimonadota bacterium]MDR7423121.1 DEAD/DEAH box helicase [Armatimonadota bacterium]MDR7454657.1 DEAD/DEAH box helicase [Armatimonadota bacterium]MDR7497547.1 DEAD/DEAH box helicase [Armatimonadota bacterium]